MIDVIKPTIMQNKTVKTIKMEFQKLKLSQLINPRHITPMNGKCTKYIEYEASPILHKKEGNLASFNKTKSKRKIEEQIKENTQLFSPPTNIHQNKVEKE